MRGRPWLALVLAVAVSGAAVACRDGEAADREVTIVVTEFRYEPSRIGAKVGERVRIVVQNRGTVLHDLTTEHFNGDVKPAGGVEHGSSTGADHASNIFHVAVDSGQTRELVFQAHAPGEYTLFCTVLGHRDAGMTARLIVE